MRRHLSVCCSNGKNEDKCAKELIDQTFMDLMLKIMFNFFNVFFYMVKNRKKVSLGFLYILKSLLKIIYETFLAYFSVLVLYLTTRRTLMYCSVLLPHFYSKLPLTGCKSNSHMAGLRAFVRQFVRQFFATLSITLQGVLSCVPRLTA